MTSAHARVGGEPTWTLADRLRKAREHAGLTQDQLADASGISRRSISAYERGPKEPPWPFLVTWALACDVQIEWLVGESGEQQPRRTKRPRPDSNRGHVAYNFDPLWRRGGALAVCVA